MEYVFCRKIRASEIAESKGISEKLEHLINISLDASNIEEKEGVRCNTCIPANAIAWFCWTKPSVNVFMAYMAGDKPFFFLFGNGH